MDVVKKIEALPLVPARSHDQGDDREVTISARSDGAELIVEPFFGLVARLR